MSRPYFSSWQSEIVDNRDIDDTQNWKEAAVRFPVAYDANVQTKAFVGWDGFVLFCKDVDIVKLARNYAWQYQEYSEACGRCVPGRWGGRILYDILDKIARGDGKFSDLKYLKEISLTMTSTSKCEIGKTVPIPILQMIKYFEDDFYNLIKKREKSPWYDIDDSRYITNVTAPCSDMCPTHIDIPAYIEGVRDLDFSATLKATREHMPLAHTCGRVCPHPCEDACRRANLDEPISIMELKRLGSDYESDHKLPQLHPKEPKPLRDDGKRVAIIGAGPAGLSAAYYLGLEGIAVTIFEELLVLGGEVTVGVPEYRMPFDKYNEDIKLVTDLKAVTVVTNHRVNADRLKEIYREFDACLLAFGARLSKPVRCQNENPEFQGYWGAISLLDKINLWHKFKIGSTASNELKGKNIVCVGGGFTSMDVVRCAIRESAKRVIMLYRRDEKTIIKNTTFEEYTEAVEEGVEFIFHSAIERIVDEDGVIKKLLVNRYELISDPDGGRAKLVKIEGADFTLECDYLIPAVSQACDLQILPKEWELEMTSWGTLKTNGKDYMTSKSGLFAAGDCEYGPMTIVNAVGQARRVASVVSRYIYSGEVSLNDEEIMEDHMSGLKVYNKNEKIVGWMPGFPREHSEKLATQDRRDNNKEVNFGFTAEQAQAEAQRCMRCYYLGMVTV